MAFVEMTAKTVDEAVAKALKELNITAEEAVVEVLEEGKKGFLGMFSKDAKVRVTAKEVAAPVVEEIIVEEVKVEVETEVEETVKEEAPAATEERAAREPKKFVVNDEAVAKAREFLQKVFNAMKIEVVMEKFVNKNDGTVTFKLHGADMGILIGKHGQTLDSLQYLTNLVANKNSAERVRVIIDVEDYRDRRIETLNRLAYRLADKVKRSGERVALEPMNPHERKIIHMALQNDRRVTTLSEGDEPYRHVVIELKK
ncbi:MAG: protein jag [Phascolarctobacterium sp.]|nr:protein jag [Phascolarctobacterium sp.]MBO5403629.1 protein jag [Phascolarctobacterium sp.]MBQ7020996.1 protein jag [Phascolarctobacterium sp.]MBR2219626.1 protein jag [Phascolarctobacterium sp.]